VVAGWKFGVICAIHSEEFGAVVFVFGV
jgi:hypothetical protein